MEANVKMDVMVLFISLQNWFMRGIREIWVQELEKSKEAVRRAW